MKASKPSELVIEALSVRKGALILRAINHGLRQEILRFIHSKGSITVTPIYVSLKLEQAVASQHLAILRNAGFVKTQRQGKFIFYSVDYKRLEQVHAKAKELLGIQRKENGVVPVD